LSFPFFEGTSPARDDGRGGRRQDGSHSGKLYGVVENLPEIGLEGTWIVDGQVVVVTKETVLNQEHGKIGVGSFVEVKGSRSGDVINAQWIEIKRRR
jgi:hypothetical protein